MVDDSATTAQSLRPKRRQLKASFPVCGRGPDQGVAEWTPKVAIGDGRLPVHLIGGNNMHALSPGVSGELIFPMHVVGLGRHVHVNLIAGEA
ncbi:hypothetical protein [Mycolicibacterium aubagnense]|uniref:hypothetical protein n=1 Tax=Mycolicibacterium aubagnense TaxID=319707 RepID=UPI0010FDD87E|nr:hypothetical protein [Mycolicibacterium aubagnense]WGI35150.1 hypothetical protein QDT91_12850 [Mycolicibacterium aubagnense]